MPPTEEDWINISCFGSMPNPTLKLLPDSDDDSDDDDDDDNDDNDDDDDDDDDNDS